MTRISSSSAIFVAISLLSCRTCDGFGTTGHSSHPSCSRLRSTSDDGDDNGSVAMARRDMIGHMFRGITAAAALATTTLSPPPALALDFDAFESGEISKDSTTLIPTLNDDEALCKYGAPGKAMGEACQRAGIKRKIPGGVDATGKVDRGDYLKCRYEYPIVDGNYKKTRVCKPSSEAEWN